MIIKPISSQQTLDLRHRVLRPGLPIEACHFDGDDSPETVHYGAFLGDSIIGIATFFPENALFIESQKPYRLRGMAVDPSRRRTGAGRAIIGFAERQLQEFAVDLIWFNARENARSEEGLR